MRKVAARGLTSLCARGLVRRDARRGETYMALNATKGARRVLMILAASAAVSILTASVIYFRDETKSFTIIGDAGVVTIAVPKEYLGKRNSSRDGHIDFGIAYPSLKPTGAAGTEHDRSVAIVQISNDAPPFNARLIIQGRLIDDWQQFSSPYPELLHFMSGVDVKNLVTEHLTVVRIILLVIDMIRSL